jgi:hypothetical protein
VAFQRIGPAPHHPDRTMGRRFRRRRVGTNADNRRYSMVLSIFSSVWWLIGFLIWVAIAFWPARVAGRKGHSFVLFFIFSLFFFPLALITAYLVRDRRRH